VKAAQQGHQQAKLEAALCYEQGLGIAQDYRQAARWYSLAAEQGQRDAGLNLGALYMTGQGAAQDYVQAHKWFQIAAKLGDQDAARAMESLAARMTREQIARAQALAQDWIACETKSECEARAR
jgi:TPR repeat protein